MTLTSTCLQPSSQSALSKIIKPLQILPRAQVIITFCGYEVTGQGRSRLKCLENSCLQPNSKCILPNSYQIFTDSSLGRAQEKITFWEQEVTQMFKWIWKTLVESLSLKDQHQISFNLHRSFVWQSPSDYHILKVWGQRSLSATYYSWLSVVK